MTNVTDFPCGLSYFLQRISDIVGADFEASSENKFSVAGSMTVCEWSWSGIITYIKGPNVSLCANFACNSVFVRNIWGKKLQAQEGNTEPVQNEIQRPELKYHEHPRNKNSSFGWSPFVCNFAVVDGKIWFVNNIETRVTHRSTTRWRSCQACLNNQPLRACERAIASKGQSKH